MYDHQFKYDPKDLVVRLKEIMHEKDINQADLADKMEVTQAFISLTLNGKKNFNTQRLAEICNQIGVSPTYLMFGKGPKYL